MTEELVTVEILDLPLDLGARAQEHHDGLTREMTLLSMQLDREAGDSDLPARLVGLVRELTGRFGSFGEVQQEQFDAAVAAGERTVDLVYQVPPDMAVVVAGLGNLLDEVDEYCRRGDYLLTLQMPPEVLAYRRWLFEEFIEQAGGRPPRPWRPPPTR